MRTFALLVGLGGAAAATYGWMRKRRGGDEDYVETFASSPSQNAAMKDGVVTGPEAATIKREQA